MSQWPRGHSPTCFQRATSYMLDSRTEIELELELLVEKQESRAVAGNPRDAAVIFDP